MSKEYAKLYTPVFQAAFTKGLFVPQQNDAGQDRYSLTAIWTPARFDAEQVALWKIMFGELDKACMTAFGCTWKKLPKMMKTGIRNGNEPGTPQQTLDGFGPGTWFASLASTQMPTVIDARTQQPIGPSWNNANAVFAGCYMDATYSVYTFKNKSSGVAIGLRSLRKIGEGKRLDGGSDASRDFADRPIPGGYADEQHETPADDDEIPF